MRFEHRALPWNIVFGAGSVRRLPAELDRLNLDRALVLTTARRTDDAELLTGILGATCIGIYDQAQTHVPVATVNQAIATSIQLDAGCTVSIGGGSTTGLGKALAVKQGLANVAIPTTYAGSEMTTIWGMTDGGEKTTYRDPRAVPDLTIYDPELTLTLPVEIAAPSGINAMAQAVVNVMVPNPNPFVRALAEEAIRLLAASLPAVVHEPGSLDARTDALLGASMAAGALALGTTGLHHRLCHTLGGSFNTPHAETHTVLLPHTVAYNARAVVDAARRVAECLGVADPATGLFDLAERLGAPTSLRSLGLRETDLDRAAEIAMAKPLSNPAPVDRNAIRGLLQRAYDGVRP